MSFAERIQKSQIAVEMFDEWLDEHHIPYAKTGYEELRASGPFMNTIRRLDDKTSARIRFFPDRCTSLNQTTLVEVKNSETIEKIAHDTYIELDNIGFSVGIVCLRRDTMLFCNISELVLQETWSNEGVPVEGMFWLAPRAMSSSDYQAWKTKHPHASGTTYGRIDFVKTPFERLRSTIQGELPFAEYDELPPVFS